MTNENVYSQIADAIVEDGYIVLENVLNIDLAKSLRKISNNETLYKKAGISNTSDLHIDHSKRRDKILWLDADNGSQSEYLDFINGLKEYLNRSLYLGLTYYESHFSIYDEGDFYEKHLDAFKNSKNRVVTTVYYLNEEWDESSGGELIIYDEYDKTVQKVIPNENTLVVFLSDVFPHEVLPAKAKRHSIAGWFRVDKS